jgi:hypothetical protein
MSKKDNTVSNIEAEKSSSTDLTSNDITKKKNHKIIPLIIVLLVVVAILAGGFYYYFSTPSRIITNIINSAYNNYTMLADKSSDFDYEKDTILVNGDLTIDTNYDGLEDLKDEKIAYSFGVDYANKKLEFGGSLTEDKKVILDAILYLIDDEAYISLKDDYSKVIKLDSSNYNFEDLFNIEKSDISIDDINYIVKEFKDILIESIDMNEFKKSSDTIKLDGKSQKVNKLTYKLDSENIESLIDNLVNNILDNDDLLDKLSKISDEDVDDIKDSLKELKNNDFEDLGKLNIYTKGFTNKFVKLELKTDDGKAGITVNKENTEIYIKDDETNISLTINEYSEEAINIDYSISENNAKVSGNLTVTSKEMKNNKTEGTISFNINYDKYKASIKSNYTAEVGASIADIDTSKSVKFSKIDSDDLEGLYNTLLNRFEDSNIYSIIEDYAY